MALKTNLFRTPRHRKYDYIPRYYNPEKEALEARIKKAEVMAEDSIEGMKSRISGKMKFGGSNTQEYESLRRKALRRSNFMLLAIIVILCILAFVGIELFLPTFLETIE